jgi:hypothetical protein
MTLTLLTIFVFACQSGGETSNLLNISGSGPNDELGAAVAALDDLNGDGVQEIGATTRTRVEVFSGADGSLLYTLDGRFRVERGLDYNFDGIDEILTSGSGGVYVYSGIDGALLLTISGLGYTMASIPDQDGDGGPDLVIGDPTYHDAGNDLYPGKVHLCSGTTGAVIWELEGFEDFSHFSYDITLIDDLDHDGMNDLAVSAPFLWDWMYGWIYFLSSADGSVIDSIKGGRHEAFGQSMDTMPDLDGDGLRDLVVGAPGVDSGANGRAVVYSVGTKNALITVGGQGWAGYSVSAMGDSDGDGWPDFLVGEPRKGINSGKVTAYSGLDGHALWAINGGSRGMLGWSVADAGDVDGDGLSDAIGGAPYSQHLGGYDTYGMVKVGGFNPWISTDLTLLSLGQATHWSYDLDFPVDAAGLQYTLLISSHGTGPFTQGVSIPLSPDVLLKRTWQANYPGAAECGAIGVLDSDGNATIHARMLNGGPWSFVIGHTLYLAAVAYPTGHDPLFSTAAMPLIIMP